MSYVDEILSRTTSCIGFIGHRGASKTWTAQFVLEMLAEKGWHPLIIDVKGEDETLHIPAKGFQVEMLKAEGLEPRGWKTAYYTFCFPLAMETIPAHFQLAPLSVKMLSFGHFRSLGGFLSPGEVRELYDAYLSAGGPEAKLADILVHLLSQNKKKPSSRIVSLLTSGFLSDWSVLEPERFLDIMERNEFTVLSNAYFAPSARDLGRFALSVVLDNLMSHLTQTIETSRIIVHFRELREVAPRVGAIGSQWHLEKRIEDFITFLRQTKTALSRVSFEAQSIRLVPKVLLENTQVLFIHPINLKEEAQRKEVEKYFNVPDRIIHVITPMTDIVPGKWVFLTKNGDAELLTSPPPRSWRIPEPENEEEAREIRALYHRLIPRRTLDEELRKARAEYEKWMSKKIEEKERKYRIELEEKGLSPETLLYKQIPEFLGIFVLATYKAIQGDGYDKKTFLRDDLFKMIYDLLKDVFPGDNEEELRKKIKEFELKKNLYPSAIMQKIFQTRKPILQLKIMGFRFWKDPTSGKIGFDVDCNAFRKHMEHHGKAWNSVLERIKSQYTGE